MAKVAIGKRTTVASIRDIWRKEAGISTGSSLRRIDLLAQDLEIIEP
jgi:hypothetical protein